MTSMPRPSSSTAFVFKKSTPYAALLFLSEAMAELQMRCSAASLRNVSASSAGIVPHAAEAPATASAAEATFSRGAAPAAAVAAAAFTAGTASADAWKPPAGEPAPREAASCEAGISLAAVRA